MDAVAELAEWNARACPRDTGATARWRPWVEIADERFSHLLIGNTQLERLCSGMRWAEGPVYSAAWDLLVWSDIPNDRMLCMRGGGGAVAVFRNPSRFANGNTLDLQGRLVSCEHASRAVTRTGHDGAITVVADRVDGHLLNSPNDVVVRRDGTVWFSDPDYGILSDYEGYGARSDYGACWLLRTDPLGRVRVVADDFCKPNGLAFSPDESALYVADSGASHVPGGPAHVRVLSLDADHRVAASRVFAQVSPGVPDGLRVDVAGNVWISCGNGLQVHAADGTLLGRVRVPETVANLCFGGPGGQRLFIAATTSIYALDVALPGCGTRPRARSPFDEPLRRRIEA